MKPYQYIILIVLFGTLGWFSTKGVKSQLVRLGDIFLYGPFLIWLATTIDSTWVKIILLFMGVSTITYNLRNYILHNNV